MNKNKDTRLVYSSDGSHLKLCKKCGEDPCECKGPVKNIVEIDPSKITLKIRLEKNQRGGKIVTIIYDLPHNPKYFEDLTKKLKNHLGTGGTLKDNIEIQGDHSGKVAQFLIKLGFKVKGVGV
jgi:translation initiation factor 1